MQTKAAAQAELGRSLSTMHADALAIFDCAVKAADPAHLVSHCLSLTPHPTLPSSHTLTLRTASHTSSYTLTPSPPPTTSPSPPESSPSTFSTVLLIAIGKAAIPMATSAHALLSPTPYLTSGLIITRHIPSPPPSLPFPIIEGGHPLPTQSSLTAASTLLSLLHSHASPSTLTLLLLSGGASALCDSPHPPLTLSHLRSFTHTLLSCGAPIFHLNTLRTSLSPLIKGGGIARATHPGALLALVLSDVVGDDVRVIGSGPGVRQRRDRKRVAEVIRRWGLGEGAPHALQPEVLRVLEREEEEWERREARGEGAEGGREERREVNVVIGSSLVSLQAARAEAERRGYRSLILTDRLTGDVSTVHQLFPAVAHTVLAASQPSPTPACIISGGETTVIMQQASGADSIAKGVGGRNQHLALLCVPALAAVPSSVLLSGGTDGSDGPTEWAGAVVTSDTMREVEATGLGWEEAVETWDSAGFFQQLDEAKRGQQHREGSHGEGEGEPALPCHIRTGPTGTNVGDVQILLVDRPQHR